ncbi:MAG TPA: carbohydrate ABC transporter permease [Verrucomicrobiae bacterium]|nr:carbohydrate ABC transporter permease [Verrucomicrobiae bacterium]
MRSLQRFFTYLLLLLGSITFLAPLLWMLSTGLKPIDQTMTVPPSWIPYRFFVEKDGRRVEVKPGALIKAPSYVAEIEGERHIVPRSSVVNSQMKQQMPSGEEKSVPVQIIQEIPADAQHIWTTVRPVAISNAVWEALPASAITKKIAPRWNNFIGAIKAMKQFPRYLKNTLILCILTVIGTVASSALTAYGFSRIEWRGRNALFMIALATMMVPFPVTMVPLYCLFRWLGWIGTLKPLWVGSFFAGAFNVFLLRQFFMTLPKDISEAARIDGCSEFRIFWQIVLPLCRPALMVVALFQFMYTWNDFIGPLIYLTNQEDFTLALGLQFFQSQNGGTEWHYLMAASTLVALPIIVLFFFTQKTFIEGISMTGIKG